jgi:hypothetical protein
MGNLSRPVNADKTVVAHRFLDDVFGESAAGARRFDEDAASSAVENLWTAPDRQSHFFSLDALSSAAEQAVALSADREVFLGVALLGGSVCARTGRGRAADAVAITALAADVDAKRLGSKKCYFPSRATALDFPLALVLVPTLVVGNGGGPRFTRSWNRERCDLADPSPSGDDLSLASFAVRDGWTDQEVEAPSRLLRPHDPASACFGHSSDAAQHADDPQGIVMPYEPERIPNGWRVRLPLVRPSEPPPGSAREEGSDSTRSQRRRSEQQRAQPRRPKERSQET